MVADNKTIEKPEEQIALEGANFEKLKNAGCPTIFYCNFDKAPSNNGVRLEFFTFVQA